MAFQINSPNLSVVIENEAIFALPAKLGLYLEKFEFIAEKFYESPKLRDEKSISKMKAELELLLKHYIEFKRSEVAVARNVNTKDERVMNQILDSMITNDEMKVTLENLIELCADALQAGQPVTCSSD